jgi:hypothetical protein
MKVSSKMAKKTLPQAAINSARGYKVVLQRITGLDEDLRIKYVFPEGRPDSEVEAEKAALEAQGFTVCLWTASRQIFDTWQHRCDMAHRNHGLPDKAVKMLRSKFGITC